MFDWTVEIRHDTRHRKWHKLSVKFAEPSSCIGSLHASQWAVDNQANPHLIAFALVNVNTGERIEHLSNATINKGE